jgi:hypothetical protein
VVPVQAQQQRPIQTQPTLPAQTGNLGGDVVVKKAGPAQPNIAGALSGGNAMQSSGMMAAGAPLGSAGDVAMNQPSGPVGGVASPPSAPGAGTQQPGMLNVNPVNQVTPPIYSDQAISMNRNQQLANMYRMTPESAASQFARPGMSRGAGTWSQAMPALAKQRATGLGNIANQEFGMRNANAQNTLDQQYRREMEGLGIATNEQGLTNAYGDLNDQARQRQINLLQSMLQGAGRLNTLGSYGGGYG